jgi:hypothetical protein
MNNNKINMNNNNNNNCALYNYKNRSNINLTERERKISYNLLLNKITYLLKNPILFNKFDEFVNEKMYHREEGSSVGGITYFVRLQNCMNFLKYCPKNEPINGWSLRYLQEFVNQCNKEEMLEVFKFLVIKIDFI